ncbi:hypothetical protein QT235_01980 [Geobacillus stearothermophilus]|nr:hypothetical protein QT235_01980 [Geobacillus stearothermophilus]WJQ10970.1 hypothetical protein QT237_01980 [Geobacillus stearothermophilus]
MKGIIKVPSRFENILPHFTNESNELGALLIEVKDDIDSFVDLVKKVQVQNGGVLSFVKGATGIGKTTTVYSMPIWRSDLFNKTYFVPVDTDFNSITQWIKDNVPPHETKINIVLLDGREITSDAVGLTNLFTSLNQLLRRRKDLIVCWPANDDAWLETLVETARKVGGRNFVPSNGVITISGPDKSTWRDILERLLIYMDKTLADLAIEESQLNDLITSSDTVGEFLAEVGDIVSQGIVDEQKAKKLPEVVFVISSGEKVESEANRIRRAGSYILKSEELTSYSPKSSSGKFWNDRNKSKKESLAYIITLFNAKLTTIKPTAVNYACLFYDDGLLSEIAKENGINKNKANAIRALESTDFYKFLIGKIPHELTSSNKGKMNDNTKAAYDSIQSKSAKYHKNINKAICSFVQEVIGDHSKFEVIDYEVDAGNGGLFIDAVVQVNGKKINLEFHHLSSKNCKASKMASYIMEKLKNYAQHYQLISR